MRKPGNIRTERLVLRAYEERDREELIALLRNDEIRRTFMVPVLGTEAEADAMFQRFRKYADAAEHFEYGIYEGDRLIGFLNEVEVGEDWIELGYVIHPGKQNRGYGTEALGAAIEALFQLGFRRVQAGSFEENGASRRVMEKCGMCPVERTEEIDYQGKRHHCLYCEILR